MEPSHLHRALVLTLPFAALACSGGDSSLGASAQTQDDSPPPEQTASSSAALTATLPPGVTAVTNVATVDIRSCIYEVGHAQLPTPPFPPQYIAYVRKVALLPTCPGPRGYQVIGQSYVVPNVAIAVAENLTIAADYEFTSTPSGSAHRQLGIKRLAPSNLAILASNTLAVPPSSTNPALGNVYDGQLVFTVPGDLLVIGTKDGAFPDELGAPGGGNYQATFTGFASSTTSNVAPTQIVAW